MRTKEKSVWDSETVLCVPLKGSWNIYISHMVIDKKHLLSWEVPWPSHYKMVKWQHKKKCRTKRNIDKWEQHTRKQILLRSPIAEMSFIFEFIYFSLFNLILVRIFCYQQIYPPKTVAKSQGLCWDGVRLFSQLHTTENNSNTY